jgi:chromosome partitioning protein
MRVVTVINAKGGCGKSTIATSLAAGIARRGFRTLLIDMDPQAQVTQWLNAGDGLTTDGTLVVAFTGRRSLGEVVQDTPIENLRFVASAEGLEEIGRRITDAEDYVTILSSLLREIASRFDVAVVDSPNQISPIMENAIYPSDVFVVPFESTKAVKSYANFYKLLLALRPHEDHQILHVLSNLTRQRGLRNRVISLMTEERIHLARTEVRSCGWLAHVDEHGGSIFDYRPRAKGAEDMASLTDEVLTAIELALPAASR